MQFRCESPLISSSRYSCHSRSCNSKYSKHFESYLNTLQNFVSEKVPWHIVVTTRYPFVAPFFVMAYHLHGIKFFVNNLLWSCLVPHDCENVGPWVICHACFQYIIYSSLKYEIDKSMALPMSSKHPLTCLCHEGYIVRLPYVHTSYVISPLDIWFGRII